MHSLFMLSLNGSFPVPQCAKQLKMDFDPIEKCVEGSLGNSLEHKMAEMTNQLSPPHTYVPWITISGVSAFNACLMVPASFLSIFLLAIRFQGTH